MWDHPLKSAGSHSTCMRKGRGPPRLSPSPPLHPDGGPPGQREAHGAPCPEQEGFGCGGDCRVQSCAMTARGLS